ncbi:hypothetical protein VNI00_011164 [Paramarasmius palmivorus]|uniref:Uncharacterized protein n=1 Tax=Paramarasmius palmivorus TaxID=297713 RepID=A0AAW0CEH2_9AGAR
MLNRRSPPLASPNQAAFATPPANKAVERSSTPHNTAQEPPSVEGTPTLAADIFRLLSYEVLLRRKLSLGLNAHSMPQGPHRPVSLRRMAKLPDSAVSERQSRYYGGALFSSPSLLNLKLV